MAGSLMYGCVLGLGFFLATKIAPQPAGSVIWWSVLTIQLGSVWDILRGRHIPNLRQPSQDAARG